MNNLTFNIQNYLTPSQQQTYNKISSSLKNAINEGYLSSDRPTDMKIVRMILEISKNNYKSNQQIKDRFFIKLLNDRVNHLDEHLTKVLQCCQRGGEEAFFNSVKTNKNNYYSSADLLQIIDLFDAIVKGTSTSLTSLSKCPHFDNGGRELLLDLKAHPENLTRVFLEEEAGMLQANQSMLAGSSDIQDFGIPLDSFQRTKEKAIRYLSALPDTHRSSMKMYLKIFADIQNNPRFFMFEEITRAAMIKLIVLATSHPNRPVARNISSGETDEMLEEISLLTTNWGEEILLSLCDAPDLTKNCSLNKISRCLKLLNYLANHYNFQNAIQQNLHSFAAGTIDLEKLLDFLENLVPEANSHACLNQENISDILARFRKDSNVSFPLDEKNLKKIGEQYDRVNHFCEEWKKLRIGQLIELANSICLEAKSSGFTEEMLLKLVSIGRLGISIKYGKYLYNTQVLTVLAQLSFKKGAFAQVKTGEGKTLIATLLAFVLSMQDKTVHNISSDQKLAMRDQEHAAVLLHAFGKKTSHICRRNREQKDFQAPVLYGTASDYEFAIMEEKLYLTPLFPQKPKLDGKRFDCVIIDELDNLTIDTARSNARISYPREVTFDWVYVPILFYVQKNISKVQKEKITNEHTVNDLRQFLKNYSGGVYKDSLKDISNSQLSKWINSAYVALYEKQNQKDYVINPKSKGNDSIDNGIVIADFKITGRLMWGMRWGEGLHEFVEVKHDFIPKKESLTPISLSHSVFYEQYDSKYGMTGTLGSVYERDEIKEIYGTPSFDVPTYRPSRRIDLPVKILPSKTMYLDAILKRVKECIAQGRPILLLCETIGESKEIEDFLKKHNVPLEMLNEVQENDEELILKKAGRPGAVTVATNTAGRGTDIILQGDSEKNGGLYVLLTFYPDSERVEFQGRGRAGRQGQHGISEILVNVEGLHLDEPVDATNPILHEMLVQRLKEMRESNARMMKNFHLALVKIERHNFALLNKFFVHLEKFQQIIKDEDVITPLAIPLSTRKIKPKEMDLNNLSQKDRQLAENALQLLTNEEVNLISWKTILMKAGERLRDKIINDWSLNFYHKVEKMFHESSIMSTSMMQTKLQQASKNISQNMGNADHPTAQFYQYLESIIVQTQNENLAKLQKDIDNLYNAHKAKWEKSLDPAGAGIIQYIKDLTQASLKNL